MIEAEKAPEENPYILSKEERTCPDELSQKEKRTWLDERIAIQRKGIEHGVSPQLLFGIPDYFKPTWRRRVWRYYLSKLPVRERLIIEKTVPKRHGFTGRR